MAEVAQLNSAQSPSSGGIAVILPAAGRASRFGAARNKLVQPLAGRPVIARTLSVFLNRPDVRQVVIAANDDSDVAQEVDPHWVKLLADPRVRRVSGGASRAHSVLAALRTVDPHVEWVTVHDAARPLVSQALIDAILDQARRTGAAVPAMPVALTIKRATGPLPAPVICTVPRRDLFAMQTPQIMRRQDLLDAFASCPIPLDEVTDDVQLLELAGQSVYLVEGDPRNLKITTQTDLLLAELILSGRG